jgi:hypothetical protein
LFRKHADTALEKYVTQTLTDIITTFFKSPFSDQSTTVQTRQSVFVQLLGAAFRYKGTVHWYFRYKGTVHQYPDQQSVFVRILGAALRYKGTVNRYFIGKKELSTSLQTRQSALVQLLWAAFRYKGTVHKYFMGKN